MQIVAIVAMRALFSRLAAHDAELPAHDGCTIRELKTWAQRLTQARYVTAPNDSMDRDDAIHENKNNMITKLLNQLTISP
jgi:hypothetical protein